MQHWILRHPYQKQPQRFGLIYPNTISFPTSRMYSLYNSAGLNFLTVFFLLNFLIPISLVILMEGIKTFSGIFLSADKKMLDPASNTECGVLNSSILEELGVVDYVLTDKTGTLTANEMMFRTIAVQNKVYNRDYLFDHQ